jgi:hypothetical protein
MHAQVKGCDDRAGAVGRGQRERLPAARAQPQRGVLQLRLGRGKLHGELSEHLRVRVERVAGRAPGAVAERSPHVGHDPTLLRLRPVARYPAEHWIHLRTTNPIESTFATVRLRQRVTKGPGSRAAGVAMAFKLIESAQTRWRAVNAPHLVALVRAGAVFKNGKLIERPSESEGGDQQVA